MSNIQHLNAVCCTSLNALYTAIMPDGMKVVVKLSKVGSYCEIEYKANVELYRINPDYFCKPIAYHNGAPFSFVCMEYKPGLQLREVLAHPEKLTIEDRKTLIEDLYQIFLVLKKSDIVVRDLHYNNLIVHNRHLILLDFQTAVSKSEYVEHVYKDVLSLAQFRGRHLYKKTAWDDAYTILYCLRLIGLPIEERYDSIYKEIEQHVGKDTIWYKLPSSLNIRAEIMINKLKSLFKPDYATDNIRLRNILSFLKSTRHERIQYR